MGGLKGDYHRTSFKLPSWQSLAPGASLSFDLVYYLPTSTPSNWTVSFGGKSYSLAGDLARGTKIVEPGDGTSGGTGGTGGNNGGNGGQCTAPACLEGPQLEGQVVEPGPGAGRRRRLAGPGSLLTP